MNSIKIPLTNLLPSRGIVFFVENFFSTKESKNYFSSLQKEIMWDQKHIVLFGKRVLQPRLTAWYGDNDKSYRYSGVTLTPTPWTKNLLEIKHKIESTYTYGSWKFTSVLLNQYRNGQDSMGWHRDNEKELGLNPTIASISLGATRKFLLRDREKKEKPIAINLPSGSLVIMAGETQKFWEHCIPKTTQEVGSRINLTFRNII
ncbi:MAG: alpha-ketoglutarate-dependent dioxygenase AlkB [Bdellovibrionaceae bacterium]|nr:alpha-ketoglutarate-dependent dioxygenase AlkB [Pseudobdellovibrionaceae bacterium]NUM57510.1 alpha-ketoglutarate-dependent dioxygenase AlkB [Pseudobdellovibrionaceae bacterium]